MVSINTNISALIAQQNLGKADRASQSSIARLSSGNSIIRASDDAAGLAVGTGLRTDVSTLRTALTNTSQANSVLSIADGALFNIGEILQRQKALASQANSGSLSDTERVFLDSEFQKLTLEIDRIADSTNFNGIKLIDGGIAGDSGLQTDTDSTDAKQTASVTFVATIPNADVAGALIINGISFTLEADDDTTAVNTSATSITIGLDASETVDGTAYNTLTSTGVAGVIAAVINGASKSSVGITDQSKIDAFAGLTATVSGDVLTITSRNNGAAGTFVLEKIADASAVASITSGTVTSTGADTLSSVSENSTDVTGSLGEGVVSASGTVGNTILTSLVTTKAVETSIDLVGELTNGDDLTIFGRLFTIQDTVTDADTQIKRESTDVETTANVVAFLNASTDPTISQFEYSVTAENATTIRVEAKTATARHQTTTFTITDDGLNSSTLTAGDGGGIDVSGITGNESFLGVISGFQAEYKGADQVQLSVTVGDYTYIGTIDDTTAAADTRVRLFSSDKDGNGGYFDIELASGQGTTVASQTNADTLADRLDSAFSSVNLQQTRKISSFDTSSNALEGGFVQLKSETFASDLSVSSVAVNQATSNNGDAASITVTLSDGRTFTNSSLGDTLHAGEKITLSNSANSNETIDIFNGINRFDLDNTTDVASLKSILDEQFASNSGGLDFQVGITAADTIAVQVDSGKTSDLYDGKLLDLTTVAKAIEAGNQLDIAINTVTSLRANIGALQSRFDFAASNLETSIQNTDAARGDFLDADIANESTAFATQQVLLQASISVLAQANQLPQNLLKLIG